MAWSWSHTADGLRHAYENLGKLSKETLCEIFAEWRAAQGKHGIVSDSNHFDQRKYERALAYANKLDHDTLVDFIWEKAEEAATCDNGGFELWMCPSGCGPHCVTPDPTDDEGNEIPTEPEDDDWTTSDYITWFAHGFSRKQVTTDPDKWVADLKAHMDEEGYFPNCWYQGERGDWNLLDLSTGSFAQYSSED